MSSLTFYPEGGAPRESDGSRAEVKIIGNTYDTAQAIADAASGTTPIAVTGPLTDAELRASAVVVAGNTPRLTASFTRGADATQYNIGDLVANSTSAASVVPLTFAVGESSGRLTGARIVVEAASGTIFLPAFDLILFRPETGIPFTAGSYPADNATLTLTADALRQVVAIFSFSASSWQNPTGGTTASGNAVYQAASLSTRAIAPFNLTTTASTNLLGLIRAQNTWNPGNAAQTINVMLDADLDA